VSTNRLQDLQEAKCLGFLSFGTACFLQTIAVNRNGKNSILCGRFACNQMQKHNVFQRQNIYLYQAMHWLHYTGSGHCTVDFKVSINRIDQSLRISIISLNSLLYQNLNMHENNTTSILVVCVCREFSMCRHIQGESSHMCLPPKQDAHWYSCQMFEKLHHKKWKNFGPLIDRCA
jgi:hypothetical protein